MGISNDEVVMDNNLKMKNQRSKLRKIKLNSISLLCEGVLWIIF